MVKLTERQRRFVEAYIETGNATKAAIMAGYSKKTAATIGAENLIKPNIQKAIKERMKEIEASKTATPEEVIKFLSSVIRDEMVEEVVVNEFIGDGRSVARIMTKKSSMKERLKAAELLLKRYPSRADADEQALRVKKLAAEVAELDKGDVDEQIVFTFDREAADGI
ncbi:MAG: terminase small subunit [Phascolarctobacterium sp.]|nr:terminase small subunit [Phascolarctobacterium sp.]MDO4920938.1 terminase small subunit [Phascolarctobacterium sp.]